MSKRSAQGPQGEKGTDLFSFNMQSTPDDKPQRATAAQLANRKIKDVRRRPRAAGTASPSAGASFGGPFSSIDPNTVSSPSASSQPMTNGFSFGQSQSFPPASSTPNPPAQNGGSQFAFGSGGGSSGFNFSASFGGTAASTPSSNPFATMNTAATSQQGDAGNFSGFKGSIFNLPPAGSQPSAQQPLPSGGLFGAGSQQSGLTGGLFGSASTSLPSSQPGMTTPSNGSIFGQSSTGAPSTNIFAQSGANKPNSFAQSSASNSDSMQTSPDTKSSAGKTSSFGNGSGGFGVSTNFGGSGAGNLFGGTTSAPSESPLKPLFGAKPAEPAASSSTSIFGGASQPSFAASPAPSSSGGPSSSGTAAPSLFGTSASNPAATAQSPFQSTNLFGMPAPATTPKPSEEKGKDESKPAESTLSQNSINFAPPAMGTSLFSKSTGTTPSQPSGLFQPPSTGSLFAPKPASSAEQEGAKPAESNPFSSLFSPKPAVAEKPKTEQKPLPSSPSFNLFAPKPASTEGAKTNELFKPTTPASPSSASMPAKPSTPTTSQSSIFPTLTPQATTPAPAPSESPFKLNTAKPTTTTTFSPSSTPSAASQSLSKLQPAKMPSDLSGDTKEQVETLNRIRLLNECFRREITKLDSTTQSFDSLVQFYLRVRDTIGAPVEGAGTKRKAPAESATVGSQSAKKPKSFDSAVGISAPATVGSTPAVGAASPGKAFAPTQQSGNTSPTGSKRKATEEREDDVSSTPAKRASGNSATASIFANTFSRSKTADSEEITSAESSKQQDAPSFKPSTPEKPKTTLFSTTPTSSPPKPLFSAPAAAKETSVTGLTSSQPPSAFKPSFNAPTNNQPPANPFQIKPSGDTDAGKSAAPLSIPKFGSGDTNFFAQFKAKSDENAEKAKAERKAEDFDSDEDDEAEWERKDAERQRKKLEEIEAQKSKRLKFVPGQGFSFDENDAGDGEKSDSSAASSFASTSVLDSKSSSQAKTSNIFGHLSATPSESGENEAHDDADDTEEASDSGDDAGRDSSFAPTDDVESASANEKTNGTHESSAQGSREDSEKPQASAEQGSGGRSLFDRVEYDQDGKPKRQGEGDKNVSSLFGSSKFASSFNSPASTPNPFASLQTQTDKSDDNAANKAAPTNLFGGSTSSLSGNSTPSIFGTGSAKPGTDNTWKLNTPIKFAAEPAASASAAKSESASTAPASDSSKPFSALFGAPSASTKSGSGNAQPTLGFSFGAPSQSSSSFPTPSVLTSGTASRASTPGVASDTNAEESADGEAAESLPQVNLARSGAGEENEDVVIEMRARGMKLESGNWTSQGVGYLRVLKDRSTSRGRVLLRADPSGKVVLNTALQKPITYNSNGTSVQFPVPKSEGPPESWALRVKTKDDATKLATAMEETKS